MREDLRPPDAKKLRGNVGYSLRVGVYRVLYDIDDAERKITIFRIKHRREAYR
jgi:mRNA interferase RelE/StbE